MIILISLIGGFLIFIGVEIIRSIVRGNRPAQPSVGFAKEGPSRLRPDVRARLRLSTTTK